MVKLKLFRKREKNRVPAPEPTNCRNCGATLKGPYCHYCGQQSLAGHGVPLVRLVGDLLENAFALDRKAPRTLITLFSRPGKLSVEYRHGRINRYVHPVKLFWMTTLFFVAIMVAFTNVKIDKEADKQQNIELTSGDTTLTGSFSETNTVDSIAVAGDEEVKHPRRGKIEKQEVAVYFRQKIATWFPYVAFAMIPVFGLLLWLFFWRSKFYYMYHLVMAVHIHTFILFYLGLLMALHVFLDIFYGGWAFILLFLLAPFIYFTIAVRRFYDTPRKRTAVWKSMTIAVIYAFVILAVCGILISVWYFASDGKEIML